MATKEIKMQDIRSFGAHLRVQGAYVQQPTPGIVGLDNISIIMSCDATSLYPTSEILSNIGYETLKGRIYDVGILDSLIGLLYTVQKNKDKGPQVLQQALPAFENGVLGMIKNYTKRKSVQNKKDFTETNIALLRTYFTKLSRYILEKGNLEDIFEPETDLQYFLLKYNLFPLMESMFWLSEKNKGYSELIVDWAFHHDSFESKYKDKRFFYFEDINSTKTKFKILNYNELTSELFGKYFLNPYGTIFIKHKNKLAYNVEQNIQGLKRRKKIKNAMLCLEGILAKYNTLNEDDLQCFLNKQENTFILTEEELTKLFMKVDETDESGVKWRVQSLKDFEFQKNFNDRDTLKRFLEIRASQLNSSQQGIKVTLNSGYGINGLVTFGYSNTLVANSITTTGKIYGIKLFQKIAVDTLENEYETREIYNTKMKE